MAEHWAIPVARTEEAPGIVDEAVAERWFQLHPEVTPCKTGHGPLKPTQSLTREGLWFNRTNNSTGMISWAEAAAEVAEADRRKQT